MKQKKLLSIGDAVEMLNALAAIDPAVDLFLSNDVQESIYNLEHFDLETGESPVIQLARECFKGVFLHLQEMTKNESSYAMSPEVQEEIKSIILLAGEAAFKLESYLTNTEGKAGRILNLPEYKELQDFYRNKLDRPAITQEKIGRWVLGIGKLPFPDFTPRIFRPTQEITTFNPQHLFIDLDEVRSDSDYELFFIRKEGGGRFFNPRLIRNMHLITEFGIETVSSQQEPLFLPLDEWFDTMAHDHALSLVRKGGSTFDFFTSERGKFKEKDLQNDLTKALLALLLASQGRFLHHQRPSKSCVDFYEDFLGFFRSAVRSYDYQKLISYPPRENNKLGKLLLSLIHLAGRVIFFEMPGIMVCKPLVNQLLVEGYERDPNLNENDLTLNLGDTLESDARAIFDTLRYYGNSALRKTLEDLDHEEEAGFDPFIQKNWPHRYMELMFSEEEIHFIRLPCPTIQKMIDHPLIIEEFKAGLRGLRTKDPEAKVLIINFQNRASWKENKRSLVIEDLNDKEEWEGKVSVVSLEVDTDFYHQDAPYDEENSWTAFRDQFKEHLLENHETLYLPESVQNDWREKGIDELLKEVHQVFFRGANHLSREERIAFIDIAYNFVILKFIDLIGPRVVAYTCKDGIELSNMFFGELYASLLLFNDRSIAQTERETLNTILFAPALLLRERAPNPQRMERVVLTLKAIETARKKKGGPIFRDTILTRLSRLYKNPLLEGQWFT